MTALSFTYSFGGLRWIHPDGTRSYQPPPAVAEQFRAYGQHYNKCIEIVRKSREEYRDARTRLVPELATAEVTYDQARQAVEALRLQLKALHKEARSRAVGTALRAQLTAAVQIRKSASTLLKSARERAKEDPALLTERAQINSRRNIEERAARAATPAYWGTYLMAEDASEKAGKSKTDPRFRRFNDGLPVTIERPCPEGKIGVQIQSTRPLTVEDLYNCEDTRLRLEAPRHDGSRRPKRSRGWIRIGSEGRAPVWAEFEVRVRRDMPKDARITWAWIQRRRIGIQWHHFLCIGVEQAASPEHAAIDKTIAIDLNMRIVADGVRIGYSFDGEKIVQRVLPQAIIDKMEHARSIEGIRDREFDKFRDDLAEWLKTAAVPPWMREATLHLSQWRSSARLAAVVLHWRRERFDGDEEMYLRAEQWRSQDRHLYDYWRNDDDAARNRRKELYRQWAKSICDVHGTVIVASWNWSEIARLPKPEEDAGVPEAVRAMRVRVALYEFVQCLQYAARSRGGRVIKAALSPMACLRCGSTALTEDTEAGSAECMQCSNKMVRDELQARALYAARERFSGGEEDGGAREGDDSETDGDSGTVIGVAD